MLGRAKRLPVPHRIGIRNQGRSNRSTDSEDLHCQSVLKAHIERNGSSWRTVSAPRRSRYRPPPEGRSPGAEGSATSASNPLILLGCAGVSGSRARGDDR